MTYPPVIQFETRAIETEARVRLARERLAGRSPGRTTRLPRLWSAPVAGLKARECPQ
jgi:hypothetical protein